MSLEPNQAIPNRRDVAEDKGIKIYFDAVETAARVEINKALVTRVFHEATAPLGVLSTYTSDAVEQLVWHVAAHEVGHRARPARTKTDRTSPSIVCNLRAE